jgi:hypothetical protein
MNPHRRTGSRASAASSKSGSSRILLCDAGEHLSHIIGNIFCPFSTSCAICLLRLSKANSRSLVTNAAGSGGIAGCPSSGAGSTGMKSSSRGIGYSCRTFVVRKFTRGRYRDVCHIAQIFHNSNRCIAKSNRKFIIKDSRRGTYCALRPFHRRATLRLRRVS